jgi:hypothetical protein
VAQEFNGLRYYKCGNYYRRDGKLMHRVVWEHFNGKIPDGHHIHHKDGDAGNNGIDNLECLPASTHQHGHKTTPEALEYAKWHMETRMRPRAIEWHGSEEGLKWHSERGRLNGLIPPKNLYTCAVCGKQGMAKQKNKKFCSPVCSQQDFRNRNPGYRDRFPRKKNA